MPFLTSRLRGRGGFAVAFVPGISQRSVHACLGQRRHPGRGTACHDTLTTPNAAGGSRGLAPLDLPATMLAIEGDTVRARGDMSVIEAESRALGVGNADNPGNGGTALFNTQRPKRKGGTGDASQGCSHLSFGAGGPVTEHLASRMDGSHRQSDDYADQGQSRSYLLSGTPDAPSPYNTQQWALGRALFAEVSLRVGY